MDIKNLHQVGEKTSKILNKLGIFTDDDLINYYPYRYNVYNFSNELIENCTLIINVIIESNPIVSYIKKNFNSLADIDDYNKYVNSFKYNTLVRFIFNESSTTINEYIGYISKVGSTLRILIYLQESNNFVYDTIISGIIENNELRISRLTNSDILTYLYNANSSGGVVLLDDDTLIPSRFLPSYVDDVIDLLGGIVESTPTSGMTAGYKYYVTSTKKIFTASSATSGITSDPISDVIYVVPDDINGTIMYRWSGTTLVEIVNSGIVIGTTTGTAFDGARGLNNENILKSVPNKLITDVSVIAQGPNDDVIIRTTYSERTNNNNSYTANKYKDYQLPEANQGRDGLMSADDKTKLDNIIIIKLTGTDLTSVNEDTDINSVKNTNIDITEFDGILESLNSDKNVKIYINEYNDAVEQTFNINCDIAFNYSSKEIFIQYDIYDVNKRIYASLYKDGDRVSLKILAVKNKYTKFYCIDSNILYNPTKGKSINLSAAQFSMQQFDELVSDIQKRKDFCVYSTVFTSKNSDVKYYRYNINCIVNSNTQLLCNYINPLDNTYIKFTMNKLTTDVQIVINEKYNINTGDVSNTIPIASATTLGGIKIPANGQMTIDKDGNLYPNAATSNSAGIVRPSVRSGLSMDDSSISVTLGRKDINLGTLSPGSTINGGYYYIYDDAVVGHASPKFKLNNNINSWEDPLAIIIVNRKNAGGMYFEGTNIIMLTTTNDCTKIGVVFIRYFQNSNENGYFVWAVPKVIQ